MEKYMQVKLSTQEEKALTFQSYGPQPGIDGVEYLPLKKHSALEGSFMELLRLSGGAVQGTGAHFDLRQISISTAVPGRINAFHIHPKEIQDELWCVAHGMLMVWLADVRADSPTLGVKRRYILTGESPALLYIPTGVAHGYKAGIQGATLIYAMNSQFNISNPNEGRLPWDFFGSELWEDDRG
jgi:dTDP-4-dehydrorhamnose 3,5-epimerase